MMRAQTLKNSHFTADRHGNLGLMAALLAMPLITLTGGGIDYMSASNAEVHLQQVLDGAAFAAAKPLDLADSERQAIAEDYMSDNLPNHLVNLPRIVEIETLGDGLTASAELAFDTTFLGIMGIQTLDVVVSARVSRSSGQPLEMVLAMDTTNSMKSISGGWDQAISQIRDILDTVVNDLNQDASKQISILPFTDRVAVGTARANWLDGPAPSDWNGCVEPREETIGSFDYALDADHFNVEPFAASISGVTGGLASRGGGYPHCGPPITGPSGDVETLSAALNSLSASGTGRFDEALAWGWRLLSPEWTGSWGTPDYPAATGKAQKILALFTDGHTTAHHFETIPFPQPTNAYNHLTPEGGALIEDLCRRIIADDIMIYVFYVNGSADSRPYFERCTNDASRFFDIDGVDQLGEALQALVGNGELRLVY